jgi:hypothetical protein
VRCIVHLPTRATLRCKHAHMPLLPLARRPGQDKDHLVALFVQRGRQPLARRAEAS